METLICSACGENKKAIEYYSSSSYFMRARGKLQVCKQCMWDYVIPNDKVSYDMSKVQSILRTVDRPFIKSLWEASFEESESKSFKSDIFKLYMKNLGMKDFRDLDWSSSELGELKESEVLLSNNEIVSIKPEKLDDDELLFSIHTFGKGFTNDEYAWLLNEYQDFKNRYECDSKGMEMLIKQIVLTELDIEKRRANNEKVDAQLKTLQDLLGSSNLKPVQETGANSVEHETFGTLIKKYENDRPIPEPDEKWKDVDGISKYISVFFTGHLARMLGKKDDEIDEVYWEEINKFTVDEPSNDNNEGDDV